MKSRNITITNIVLSLISFSVSVLLTFVLNPITIKTFGEDAYGFIGLANNFVQYSQLFTIALNSMSLRFISLSFYKKDYDKMQRIYSTIFYANLILGIIMIIFFLFIVVKLEYIVNVPKDILFDIKILWLFIFTNFFISTVTSIFGVPITILNKMYIFHIKNIILLFFRFLILYIGIKYMHFAIWSISLGTLIVTIFSFSIDKYFVKKYFSYMKVRIKMFNIIYLKDIFFSGCWQIFIKISYILTESVDLLFANLFIGSSAMGILAVAKTIPSMITQIKETIVEQFKPIILMHYDCNNMDDMMTAFKICIETLSIVISIPLMFLIVFGKPFFSLWIGGENIDLVYITSCVYIMALLASSIFFPLNQIFIVKNDLKGNSVINCLFGLLNVFTLYIAMQFDNNAILLIPIISGLTIFVRDIIYLPIHSLNLIFLKKSSFYMIYLKYVLSCLIILLVFLPISNLITNLSWSQLIFSGFIFTMISILFLFAFFLSHESRKYIVKRIRRYRL